MKFPDSRISRLAHAVAASLMLLPACVVAQAGRQGAVPLKTPPGMCRILVDGVPASKQPAPTDCATALKNKPANSRVEFGEPASPARANTSPAMNRSLNTPVVPTSPPRTSVRDSIARTRDTTKVRPPARPKRDTTGTRSGS